MLKKERISESELLTRLLEGERQAFDEIFTRYYSVPLRTCMSSRPRWRKTSFRT